MAKRAVEVCECDRCGKEPANTWFITGPDGVPREIELCEQHAAPIANAYALGRPVTKKPQRPVPARTRGRRAARAQAEEPQPSQPQPSQPQPSQQPSRQAAQSPRQIQPSQPAEEQSDNKREQPAVPALTFTSLPKPNSQPAWR